MQSTRLSLQKIGYVDQQRPDTHLSASVGTWYQVDGSNYGNDEKTIYLGFSPMPSSLRRRKLYGAKIYFQINGLDSDFYSRFGFSPCNDFNAASLTYNNAPGHGSATIGGAGQIYYREDTVPKDISLPPAAISQYWDSGLVETCANLVRSHTCAIFWYYLQGFLFNAALKSGGSAYVDAFYDDAVSITSKVVYKSGPISGYSNPRSSTTFAWEYTKADTGVYAVDENFSQSSATFFWKTSEEEAYHSINISGNTPGVTVAANTFPAASTIEWYVQGTDTDGTTTQTDVFTFSTTAGTATATARSPIDSVEDGSGPITFTWTLGSTDGQTPSAVDLWWKTPDEASTAFHTLLDAESPAPTSYTVPANTFPAGEIQWLIRAYNVDGTAGPWSRPSSSSYYSFICVAAPDSVLGLAATEVPLTTISWQSDGQEAYEISIDGEVVRKAWGTGVYSWQVDEPLSEGDHVIAVRVQGVYGLWSQPSTITVTVGGPSSAFVISGEFGSDAVLSAEGGSDESLIHWYRDGVQIGTSTVPSFVDFRALGTHDYFARIFLSGGNYSQSNTVSGSMAAPVKKIRELADLRSQWLELKLSENSADEEDFTWKQIQTAQHVTGAEFPELETSDYQDEAAAYNVAFPTAEEGRRLEALRGKMIILKSRGGNVVIGSLGNLQKRVTAFYVAYTFTIQRIHAEDFVHYE